MACRPQRTYSRAARNKTVKKACDTDGCSDTDECDKENLLFEGSCQKLQSIGCNDSTGRGSDVFDKLLSSPMKQEVVLKPLSFWDRKCRDLEATKKPKTNPRIGKKKCDLYELSPTESEQDSDSSAGVQRKKKQIKKKKPKKKQLVGFPKSCFPIKYSVLSKRGATAEDKRSRRHEFLKIRERVLISNERQRLENATFTLTKAENRLGLTSTPGKSDLNIIGPSNFGFMSPVSGVHVGGACQRDRHLNNHDSVSEESPVVRFTDANQDVAPQSPDIVYPVQGSCSEHIRLSLLPRSASLLDTGFAPSQLQHPAGSDVTGSLSSPSEALVLHIPLPNPDADNSENRSHHCSQAFASPIPGLSLREKRTSLSLDAEDIEKSFHFFSPVTGPTPRDSQSNEKSTCHSFNIDVSTSDEDRVIPLCEAAFRNSLTHKTNKTSLNHSQTSKTSDTSKSTVSTPNVKSLERSVQSSADVTPQYSQADINGSSHVDIFADSSGETADNWSDLSGSWTSDSANTKKKNVVELLDVLPEESRGLRRAFSENLETQRERMDVYVTSLSLDDKIYVMCGIESTESTNLSGGSMIEEYVYSQEETTATELRPYNSNGAVEDLLDVASLETPGTSVEAEDSNVSTQTSHITFRRNRYKMWNASSTVFADETDVSNVDRVLHAEDSTTLTSATHTVFADETELSNYEDSAMLTGIAHSTLINREPKMRNTDHEDCDSNISIQETTLTQASNSGIEDEVADEVDGEDGFRTSQEALHLSTITEEGSTVVSEGQSTLKANDTRQVIDLTEVREKLKVMTLNTEPRARVLSSSQCSESAANPVSCALYFLTDNDSSVISTHEGTACLPSEVTTASPESDSTCCLYKDLDDIHLSSPVLESTVCVPPSAKVTANCLHSHSNPRVLTTLQSDDDTEVGGFSPVFESTLCMPRTCGAVEDGPHGSTSDPEVETNKSTYEDSCLIDTYLPPTCEESCFNDTHLPPPLFNSTMRQTLFKLPAAKKSTVSNFNVTQTVGDFNESDLLLPMFNSTRRPTLRLTACGLHESTEEEPRRQQQQRPLPSSSLEASSSRHKSAWNNTRKLPVVNETPAVRRPRTRRQTKLESSASGPWHDSLFKMPSRVTGARDSVLNTTGINLVSGKGWRRSLLLAKQMQNGTLPLADLDTTKGRGYRDAVQHVASMQNSGLADVTGNMSLMTSKMADMTLGNATLTCHTVRLLPAARHANKSSFRDFVHDTVLEEESAGDKARRAVLERCGQTSPVPFKEHFNASTLPQCKKIGEGVYGEVFMYGQGSDCSVIKVIPIEGSDLVNGEPQKTYSGIISEIVIAMELSNLRFNCVNQTNGFSEMKRCWCVQGEYPAHLVHLWNKYDAAKKSENDSPTMFGSQQLYIVLELANGGRDLEAFVFSSAAQAHSILLQAAYSLAIAEQALEFEHRDLHWGNILISNTKETSVKFILNGCCHNVSTKGVQVAIIDFTLSRMCYDGCSIFNNLAVDPSLFTSHGDFQFEVYRLMRTEVENDWSLFRPKTNIHWLKYVADKMATAARYKRVDSKIHTCNINVLKRWFDKMDNYSSCHHFVRDGI